MPKALWLAAALLVLPFGPAAHATVVVPGANAATEGDGFNILPFGLGGTGIFSEIRYQQAYAAAEVGSALVIITDVVFRPDKDSSAFGPLVLPNMTITLSTSANAIGSMDATFANNVGADVVTVYSGSLTLSSAFTGPAPGPKDFDIVVHLQSPFLYDPSAGMPLLLDVTNQNNLTTTPFDKVNSGAGSVTRLFSANAASATADFVQPGQGLVTEFLTADPVPALSSWRAPLIAGLLLATALWQIRRRRCTPEGPSH